MGSLGSRFGRNVPLEATMREPEDRLLEPNPRLVSRELLTRHEFQPATTLNLLAGAWIQFEVHDWFSHGKNEAENPWLVPLDADDPWPEHPMPIERTRRDPSADPGRPPTFVTDDTHWWDGSQIYGREPAFAKAIRTGAHGKLRLDEHGTDPAGDRGITSTSPVWPGTSGSVSRSCTRSSCASTTRCATTCTRRHPELGDDELFDKARLVVCRADGQDPHGRLDAGDHRPPDDGPRHAGELVGARGRTARQAHRPPHLERGDPRHSGLADESPRRPLFAHRGVRRACTGCTR